MKNPTYKGWEIDISEDREDDNTKLFHDVRKDGEDIMLDLSPYGTNDADLCAAMIDLDFPTRKDVLPNGSIAPLRREDVARLWREKFGDAPMPKAERDERSNGMKHTVTIHSFGIDKSNKVEAENSGLMASGTFEFESNKTDGELWEQVFDLQNDRSSSAGTKALPNVCSMTAGDIMNIDGQWILCGSIGWFEIDEKQANLWMEMSALERSQWARNATVSMMTKPITS